MVLAAARHSDHPQQEASLCESVAAAAGFLRGEGATVRTRVLTGSATDLARSVCDEEGADLLMLTLHGGRGRRWFTNVAHAVLRCTNLPVLLVPIPDREQAIAIGGTSSRRRATYMLG
jgi:nucleotide-binding universal stress UspA family protein